MVAGATWKYMCAAHKQTKECSAIDYMIHSLDHSTAILHNQSNFASRVTISASGIKQLLSIARRIYRLFSHTYYQHKEIFLEFEAQQHLCARFTLFTKRFGMMDSNQYTIPDEVFQI